MLNKIVHIIFAALIFLGTTGMTVSKHYCGTSLKSISVNISPDNCCDEPEDCCHNETLTLQLESDFSIVSYNFDFNTLVSILSNASKPIQNKVFEGAAIQTGYFKGSPPKIQEVLSRLQAYLL